jgi:hypothetical protein
MNSNSSQDTVKVVLSDGTIVLMDCNNFSGFDGPVTVQGLTIAAEKTFRVIKSIAMDMKNYIKEAKPDKAKVEFSIELEKKGNDVFSKICNVSGKSGIKITLEWDF